jgi:hypothetical protein
VCVLAAMHVHHRRFDVDVAELVPDRQHVSAPVAPSLSSSFSRFPSHSRRARMPAAPPPAGYRCISRTPVARKTMPSDSHP